MSTTAFSINELKLIRENINSKNDQEIAELIGRPVNEIQEVTADVAREKPIKKLLQDQKLIKQQQKAKERHAMEAPSAEVIPVKIEKPIPTKKEKPILPPKQKKIPVTRQKVPKPAKEKNRTELVKDARKSQRNLEEKRIVEKGHLQQRRTYKDKKTDYTTLKTVRIDSKTIIYIKPGEDEQAAIRKYKANNCNDVMRMKIRDSNFA